MKITDEEIEDLANADSTISGWREFENSDTAESNDMKKVFKRAFKLGMNQESDAAEFKDWCDNGKAWFFDNNEEHTHTTEELYKLFKNELRLKPTQ